jgi:cyclopropane fatty-acyl-phospholipid synthase-like methyltransferase
MFSFLNRLLGPSQKKGITSASQAPPGDGGIDIQRLDLIQHMWGVGLNKPGSPEYIVNLARSLILDPQTTTLDVSAGLGGTARTLAKYFKTYVSGLERDGELVKESQTITDRSGFLRHVSMEKYNPDYFAPTARVDAVVMREFLYTVRDKEAFMSKVANALKPKGQLLITDFICEDVDYLNRPPTSLWLDAEPYGAAPISVREMTHLLRFSGFDLRLEEDMTKPYTHEILFGLARVAKYLEGRTLNKATKERFRHEVDLWVKCLSSLDTAIKNMRFFAIKM